MSHQLEQTPEIDVFTYVAWPLTWHDRLCRAVWRFSSIVLRDVVRGAPTITAKAWVQIRQMFICWWNESEIHAYGRLDRKLLWQQVQRELAERMVARTLGYEPF